MARRRSRTQALKTNISVGTERSWAQRTVAAWHSDSMMRARRYERLNGARAWVESIGQTEGHNHRVCGNNKDFGGPVASGRSPDSGVSVPRPRAGSARGPFAHSFPLRPKRDELA